MNRVKDLAVAMGLATMHASVRYDHLGGILPLDTTVAQRYQKVGMVTFPKNIVGDGKSGTRCTNCRYFKSDLQGYCAHPEVLWFVNEKMCCDKWVAAGVFRAYEHVDQEPVPAVDLLI